MLHEKLSKNQQEEAKYFKIESAEAEDKLNNLKIEVKEINSYKAYETYTNPEEGIFLF